MAHKKIAVLCGGRGGEREISLRSGAAVVKALRHKYEIVEIDIVNSGWMNTLETGGFDAAFLALHGGIGENGSVQGALECLGIPYTGSGVLASALGMDKSRAKVFAKSLGIPTPPSIEVAPTESFSYTDVVAHLGDDIVVKPACGGSAVNVCMPVGEDEFNRAIKDICRMNQAALVERRISGRELTVAVLGRVNVRSLPIIEIISNNEFYNYEAKYVPGMSKHICPASISEQTAEKCTERAVKMHLTLGCAGASRSDFILDEFDESWYLETNTIPGMTETSLLPDAARAAGIPFPELCSMLIEETLLAHIHGATGEDAC